MNSPLPGHTDEQILQLARQANRAVFWRWLSIFAVVGIGIVGFVSSNAAQDAARALDAVKANQVTGCEVSLEPGGIRYIQASGIAREIQSSAVFKLNPENVASAFGLTVEEARQALLQSDQNRRDQIQDLLGVSCDTGRAIRDPDVPVPSVQELAATPAPGSANEENRPSNPVK
jgi:hypothetical protein